MLRPIQDPYEMDMRLPEVSSRVGLPAQDISRALARCVRSILSANAPFDNTGIAWHPSASAGPQSSQGTPARPGPGTYQDDGRFVVTGREADRGAFKTPTLREVARTSPYMHDGNKATLEEVVKFYDEGGRPNPAIDPEIHPLKLTVGEKRTLVTFLRSLSGNIREGR